MVQEQVHRADLHDVHGAPAGGEAVADAGIEDWVYMVYIDTHTEPNHYSICKTKCPSI
jgi:hypothetical protein